MRNLAVRFNDVRERFRPRSIAPEIAGVPAGGPSTTRGDDWARRLFLGAVILLGVTVIAASVRVLPAQLIGYQWYILVALTLVSGSTTVKLPSVPASISVSETFVFASVLLFGSAAGTVTVALDGLVISFWMASRRQEWYRPLFNMSAPALSIWCASQLLSTVGGVQPLLHNPVPIDNVLLPLALFAVVYFVFNSSLIAFAVAFETHVPPYRIWREHFLWLSLNYFSGASVALLLVVYTRDVDLRFIGIIVPLLLVLYVTFKTAMGRVQDANRHVEQIHRLYLSTIETLAMTVDAKDHITHHHLRRVQSVAIALARRLGVTDDTLLKAIEAAALLHDIGKLMVPEYILNKPGPLTRAEFDKMKGHAGAGADLLTAIAFPYPVVPIVRHHHENWDGTGYPDGVRGADIPIGARILSVVDCFDALTSDRPYRPRLTNDDALAILAERRGKMYDPFIVDTFIRVHREILEESLPAVVALAAFKVRAHVPAIIDTLPSGPHVAPAPHTQDLSLHELAAALDGQTTVDGTADVTAQHIHGLIPCSLCVFYLYDAASDELEAPRPIGEGASAIRGLRIVMGRQLSGWVAANRQTLINADPILDLGDVARTLTPPLRSSLATPLVSDDALVGVLTVYSPTTNAFTEDHRTILEIVATHASRRLSHLRRLS